MQIKKREEEELIINIPDMTPTFANTLRRIMLAEIPCFAIEYLKIFFNNTVMSEEIIANRLGLIPYRLNRPILKYVKLKENLESESLLNEENSLKFKLDVNSERKNFENPVTVFSDSIKFEGARPVYKGLPLLKIAAKQNLSLEGYGTMGIGKEHTKWSPVGTAFYRIMDESIEFVIQSNGQYDNEEIFLQANMALIAKLNILKKEFSNL